MELRRFLTLGAWSMFALAVSTNIAAQPHRSLHTLVQRIDKQDNWGHPDLQGEHDGMRAFARGHYRKAMTAFLQGARYADKLSQLCIGLMYLNGKGVEADPARAWAWFSIAAQRHYPGFADTRDRTWSRLSPAQRQRAQTIRARLLPVYGDHIAKTRMRAALEHNLSRLAGSLIKPGTGGIQCITPAGEQHNCDDIYAGWRWNPKRYFATRDALYRGTVSVGHLKQVDSGTRSGR